MRSLAFLVALALLAGCTDTSPPPSPSTTPSSSSSPPLPMSLASPAFASGAAIPQRHTCDGDEVSPPLNVTRLPAGTVSVALTMKDPDVPTPVAPVRTIVHWVVWGVAPAGDQVAFPEGSVPAGARQGANDFGNGYLGPCPPPGSPAHRYNFTAYALDNQPDLPANATAAQLEGAMAGHVLGKATLTGLYTRKVL
ncbi:MAG TPA: YbhB/YbcL family Raf kinase inhibitor-like protein [Candidatus Thermoplasmatota archaeon]|nr:YbhB/YbcL family Raf kinase inhibitor-like protein [Candidatus Thermoplasmatota archaeon]